MTLNVFDALREEVAISHTDLMEAGFHAAVVEPTRTCIDTTPELTAVTPELRHG